MKSEMKMAQDREWKVKWKCLEIEKWNFSRNSWEPDSISRIIRIFSTMYFQMCPQTVCPKWCKSECDEYIRIFEYSNILVTNIYSDIRSYQFFFYEYIRTFVRVKFVCTNIFRHSLVSVLECKTLTNIRIYSNIHAIFNTNTYSDIRSCQKN